MLPSFEKLDGDRKTDVLIIGGGMAGVLCAYALSKKGVDYLLVEADRIGQGVTGCTTAKITAQHGLIYDALISKYGTEKARMYLEANLLAVQRYREWCAQIDCDFAQKDNFVYASEMKKLEIELLALEKLGYPAQFVKDVPLPLKTAGAVGFACQAQFHPLKFLAGIAKGLRIYEHTRVTGYDGKAFLTEHGRITARKAIVATHFPIFNKHGLYPLKQYQHRSYVLALKNAAAVPGMYVDEKETGLSFRMAGICCCLAAAITARASRAATGRSSNNLPRCIGRGRKYRRAGPRRIACRWMACRISGHTAAMRPIYSSLRALINGA